MHGGHRLLALGDSYTIGESVAEDQRWPVQLVRLLRRAGIRINEPLIIAQTGWTTDELGEAIEKEQPSGVFDIVTLLIGVNNQYRGRSGEEYRKQFRELLVRAIAFADGRSSHVIVLSIPDWSVMPFAEGRDRETIARAIDHFNAINCEEALALHAPYVDITPVSRKALQDKSLIAPDRLHPSAAMYEQWAELMLPVALRILGGQ